MVIILHKYTSSYIVSNLKSLQDVVPNHLVLSCCDLSVILPIISLSYLVIIYKETWKCRAILKYTLFYGGGYEWHGSKIGILGLTMS